MTSTSTSRAGQFLATASVVLASEVTFFGLRAISKAIKRAPIGADDVLIIIAFPIVIALDASLLAMVKHGGAGRHVQDIITTDGPSTLVTFLKLLLLASELYIASMAFAKLSILSLYLRIFRQRAHRIACRILQFIIVAYTLSWGIALMFICTPINRLWSLEPLPGPHCGNISALGKYISIPNIITDVVMLLLPFCMMWPVQMCWKDKIVVGLTLCAGGLGFVISCLRFHIFFQPSEGFADITDVVATIGIYTALESGAYFIAACVPVLQPLLSYVARYPDLGFFGLPSFLKCRKGLHYLSSSEVNVGREASQHALAQTFGLESSTSIQQSYGVQRDLRDRTACNATNPMARSSKYMTLVEVVETDSDEEVIQSPCSSADQQDV